MEIKLLDRVREAIRTRHYSPRTEEAYVHWIRRFIVHQGTRHPREMGETEVSAFVSSLAARGVSASTQNQALSAVLFLYEVVTALWLGHESVETTQMYLHAHMRIKERALARTTPTGVTPGRYHPTDRLLAFLEGL